MDGYFDKLKICKVLLKIVDKKIINFSSSKKEKKKNIISLGAGCFLTHNTERVTKHSKSAQASNHCTIVCVCVCL